MFKIIKHLKPYVVSILCIIAFLLLQAVCDLSLPDYMSNIVNVGIQQGGVEAAVPKAIRQSEMEKLITFMSDTDKQKVLDNYNLLQKEKLSQDDYEKYLEDYPLLEKSSLYELNTKEKSVLDELNTIFGKPMLIVMQIEKSTPEDLMKMFGGMQQGAGAKAEVTKAEATKVDAPKAETPNGGTKDGGVDATKQMDPFMMLSKMPKEQLAAMQEQINKKFAEMPDSIITQTAIAYIHMEYDKVGIDVDSMQSVYILVAGLKMLLIALVSMAAAVVVGYLASKVSAGFSRSLRKSVFSNVVSYSNAEFDKFSTSSLITRSTNDIQQVQMFIIMLLRIVFYAPILGIGGVLKVINTDTSMAWIIGVAVLAILSLVMVLFGVAMPKFKSMQKLVDKINLVTREALTGMMVIRAFSTQKNEEDKFEKANQDFTKTNLFVNRTMALMMPMMMLIMNGITLLIVWVSAHQIDKGAMQVGNMMAFIQYAMQIIMSFLMISMVSIILPRASVSIQRISEVLGTTVAIKDPKNPKHFGKEQKGYVEFKNVSFKYPGAEEDVLSNICFTAKPGQTTAFIGSTGSGKSTLINLIPRFYDVTDGQILIDGTDIRDVTQHELREKIGYVPQKGVLFTGTIESNLKYGCENATEDDLKEAAEIAQATEFISEKPDGFDTSISQGGTNVSGGQKQRLSIARALVKKPKVFIFDDSFSALDFKTDATLRRALKAKTQGSTVLIVAQRISTIMTAEQILVLDEGKVVGMGTHKELLENCDVYKQIAFSQLSKEELLA